MSNENPHQNFQLYNNQSCTQLLKYYTNVRQHLVPYTNKFLQYTVRCLHATFHTYICFQVVGPTIFLVPTSCKHCKCYYCHYNYNEANQYCHGNPNNCPYSKCICIYRGQWYQIRAEHFLQPHTVQQCAIEQLKYRYHHLGYCTRTNFTIKLYNVVIWGRIALWGFWVTWLITNHFASISNDTIATHWGTTDTSTTPKLTPLQVQPCLSHMRETTCTMLSPLDSVVREMDMESLLTPSPTVTNVMS